MRGRKLLLGTGIFLMVGIGFQANSQRLVNTQWFFGNSEANIQFDKNAEFSYEETRMNADFGTGGPTVISEQQTGNLRAYSDGVRIYDGSHQLMSGFSTMNGNSQINQSAVSCKLPGTDNNYLLFTNSYSSGVNEIQYAEIDLTAIGNGNSNEPLGEVNSVNNSTGIVDPSEAMIIIESSIPNTYWLVTQNRNTLDFHASIVNEFGIGGSSISNLDTTLQYPGAEASQFDYDPINRVLAVAPKDINRNVVLLDFNDTTGLFSFNRSILNSGFNDNGGESVFDVEWSNDGSKLYFSRFGATDSLTANVYQHNLIDSTTVPFFSNPIFRSYGLKRGIDGNLYHLYQSGPTDPFLVGRFENIDSSAFLVSYEANQFDADFNGRQFPSFVPAEVQSFSKISFRYLDSCANEGTKFFPDVFPVPTNYFWDFGDGNFSNSSAPIHVYEQPGTFFVTLLVELNGTIDLFQQPVIILQTDLMVDLGQDTTICADEILELDAGEGLEYLWSTGSNNQTINVDTTGIYWVSVSDGQCSSYDEIEVSEYNVSVDVGNQWYFGERAGLDFNTQPPTPITDANMMFSPEGAATISDVNGDLLFYTNGSTVWNREHQVMPVFDSATFNNLGANQIGGDSTASQGVLILPFMDDNTMFYIFTAQEVYGTGVYDMRYSIVDIKQDSARGAVLLRNLPLFQNSTERITNSSFDMSSWLAAHEYGNNSFRNYFVDESGIGPNVFTPLGEVIAQQEIQGSGVIKFDPTTSYLATVTPGAENLEIFNFVDSSGRLSTPRLVDTEETNTYGLEWSSDASKIYVSTNTKLLQYSLDSIDSENPDEDIAATKYDGYPTGNGYGTLQTGPDGQIYLAVEGSGFLFTVDNQNSDREASSLNTSGQDLAGRISRRGLPNFSQQQSNNEQPPALVFDPGCFGQESMFNASGTSVIDEFFWTFDSTAAAPTAVGEMVLNSFSTLGIHPFELNITNRCGYDTVFMDTVNVFQVPSNPTIDDSGILCIGDVALEAWPEDRDDYNYWWSTGDTTRTVEISEANFLPGVELLDVGVAIITDEGCSSDTLIASIGNNRPFLDLGVDQILCQNEPGVFLDANTASGISFDWQVDGLSAGTDTSRFLPVNTSIPGEYQYTLTISLDEAIFGAACTNTDTVNVLVGQSPGVISITNPPSECGERDASIQFDITTPGSFSFTVRGIGLARRGSLDGPATSPRYDGLGTGNYELFVEDLVSGCSTFDPVTIEDDALFDVSASNLPDCGIDANVQISLTGAQLPSLVDVFVSDLDGDTLLTENNLLTPIRSFQTLDNGTYYINIREVETGCTRSDTVLVQPYIAGVADCDPLIIAPNAFSPNGNNFNEEFFIIPNPFVDNFEIFIYSKWGELVYYSQDQTFRWNGSYRNDILGPGTFAYVMKFTSIEEPELGTLTQYGSVTILR